MKHYVKILAAVAVFGFAGAAQAENSLKAGSMALNVSVFDGTAIHTATGSTASELFIVQGKYFLQKDLAILAGAGIAINGGDAKGTDFGFRAGARKYLKNADFSPFMGGYFSYSTTQDSNVKIMQIMAEFGAEYFMSKQFSVEGAARAGYASSEIKAGATTNKSNVIGTASGGISFNFYF